MDITYLCKWKEKAYMEVSISEALYEGVLISPGRKHATVAKLGIYLAYPHEAQYTS